MSLRRTLALTLALLCTAMLAVAQPPTSPTSPTPVEIPKLSEIEAAAVERVRLLYSVVQLEFENARLRYENAIKNVEAERVRVETTLTIPDGFIMDWATGQLAPKPQPVTKPQP